MKLRMFQRYARFIGLFGLVAVLVTFTSCRQVDPQSPEIDQEESTSQSVSASESDSGDSSWEDLDEEDEDMTSLDSPDDSTSSGGQAEVRTTHEVKPGENLWDIAERYYDRGIYWRAIRDHNNLSESGDVNAGQTIEIPKLTEQRKDQLRQMASDQDGSGGTSASGSTGSASGGDMYVTKEGDTFWKIAKRVYGNGSQWKRIWRANKSKVPNPDKLKAGTEIRIPGGDASSADQGGTGDEQKGSN